MIDDVQAIPETSSRWPTSAAGSSTTPATCARWRSTFWTWRSTPTNSRACTTRWPTVYEQKIHAAGKAGADAIMIGEDMGTQKGLLFSPAMFRDYFKPMYTRLMGIAHEYGMKVLMHSCGQNWEIVPDLLDAAWTSSSSTSPRSTTCPSSPQLRERKAALWRPVDIQKILPTGDREMIERRGRDRMFDTLRRGPDLQELSRPAGHRRRAGVGHVGVRGNPARHRAGGLSPMPGSPGTQQPPAGDILEAAPEERRWLPERNLLPYTSDCRIMCIRIGGDSDGKNERSAG